jgi:hypothetical protein
MASGLEIPDKPDPQYWRDRARRTFARADQAADPRTKRMLLGVAESYERLAERIEVRLRLLTKIEAPDAALHFPWPRPHCPRTDENG